MGNCDAPLRVEIDEESGDVTEWKISDSYYHMGHFSRYMPRGSVRVGMEVSQDDATATKGATDGTDGTDGDGSTDDEPPLKATAVRTPSGEVVAVLLNTGTDAVPFTLAVSDGRSVEMQIPPNAIQTFIFDALDGGDEREELEEAAQVAPAEAEAHEPSAEATSEQDRDCPYSVFNWVGSVDDNPYFWQSPSFDWNATTTVGVFGDITKSTERVEMRDFAQARGIKVVAGVSPSHIDVNNGEHSTRALQVRVYSHY